MICLNCKKPYIGNHSAFCNECCDNLPMILTDLKLERDTAQAENARLAAELKQVLESPIRNAVILEPPLTDLQARAFEAIREIERWKAATHRFAQRLTTNNPYVSIDEYGDACKAIEKGDLDALEAALGIGDKDMEDRP